MQEISLNALHMLKRKTIYKMKQLKEFTETFMLYFGIESLGCIKIVRVKH